MMSMTNRPPPLSDEEREKRRPLPLEIQLHLEDGPIDIPRTGKARPAKTTRVGYRYTELIRQEYRGNACVFSGGMVSGHPVDTLYIRLEREGEPKTEILFRPDEVAALAWICTGILWSDLVRKV